MAFLEKYRFSLLFVTLLWTIGGAALLAEFGLSGVLSVLILLNLLVLLAVLSGQWALRVGWGLFILSLISWGLSTWVAITAFNPGGQISAVILLVLGTLGCLRVAFSPGPVDRERLAAALDLYLLLGLIFALIFTVIAELLPGSFHFAAAQHVAFATRPLSDMVYFSFVTMATLGYGDIIPLSGSAKGLAILEAIIGQMYLVVVVARLVSLYRESEEK
ncbi:MAG: two pore domain potassium channel family protein [Deltaproteobacteria bacterium]|nr:two pore domain potassium channel family protein [Deltaproteobacteria bacterium]